MNAEEKCLQTDCWYDDSEMRRSVLNPSQNFFHLFEWTNARNSRTPSAQKIRIHRTRILLVGFYHTTVFVPSHLFSSFPSELWSFPPRRPFATSLHLCLNPVLISQALISKENWLDLENQSLSTQYMKWRIRLLFSSSCLFLLQDTRYFVWWFVHMVNIFGPCVDVSIATSSD